MYNYNDCSKLILDEVNKAMSRVDENQVDMLIDAITSADNVFLTGVGRSLISLQAFCKRLNHLGINAHCVGDLNEPAASARDLLIVGSASGQSVCPVAIAQKAAALGLCIAHIGSNADNAISSITDIFIRIPVKSKLDLPDEMQSGQIMSSLFEQSLYLLCDAMALMIAKRMQADTQKLWQCHANLE